MPTESHFGIAGQAFQRSHALRTRLGHHIQQVGAGTSTCSLQDGEFHHFYAVWTPKHIRMYVDNVAEPYLSVDIDATQAAGADSTGAYFHKPNFLLFNLARRRRFHGIHNPTPSRHSVAPKSSAASMEIDYVRVYSPPDMASNDLTSNKQSEIFTSSNEKAQLFALAATKAQSL